ncbi:MAG TPA: tetratricopeptide repeat protein [Rubricoccaceae bacterium]
MRRSARPDQSTPMAQINPPKTYTATRHDSLREDGLQTAVAEGSVFFERHRTAIIATVVGLLALLAAVFGYRAYQESRSEEAQGLLGAVLNEYQAGNFQAALDGTGEAPGLLEIAETYGATATGQQATFLAADALYQLGKTDEALAMFEEYDGEGLFEASALAGQASIYEQKGDAARAADLYEQAAAAYATPAAAPGYLLDAARAHAAAGHADQAQTALQTVLDDYEDAPEAQAAQVELGRTAAAAEATGQATGGVQPAPPPDTTAAAPAGVPGLTGTVPGSPVPVQVAPAPAP